MGGAQSKRTGHSHAHLRHATRRAHSHAAHYALRQTGEEAELGRSAHNAFHDAMHHAHELSAQTAGAAPAHRRTHASASGESDEAALVRDLEAAQRASEHWLEQFAHQINSGDGLRAHLVFGADAPIDAAASASSAQTILAMYGQ